MWQDEKQETEMSNARFNHFMKSASGEDTLVLMDYDGTLHKGLFPALFNGRANADLAVFLLVLKLNEPVKAFKLLKAMARLFMLKVKLSQARRKGRVSRSEAEELLIRYFASRILSLCGIEEIKEATSLAAGFTYAGAWEFLKRLDGNVHIAIVSKSFEFLLRDMAFMAFESHGVGVELHGVRIGRTLRILSGSILTRAEKSRMAGEIVGNGRFVKVIVIGDTADDIAMRDAAAKILCPENVLLIALSAKDGEIEKAADVNVSSWSNLDEMLGTEKRGWR